MEKKKYNNEAEIESIFNALPYFRLDAVLDAKKCVEHIIENNGINEQRSTALDAFNRMLHED